MILGLNQEKKVFAVTLLLMLTTELTQAKTTIFGANNAQHFSTNIAGPFYIQVASFKSEINAKNYQKHIRGLTHYPVTIQHRDVYHMIMIGPMPTVQTVRVAASQYLSLEQAPYTSVQHEKKQPSPVIQQDLTPIPAQRALPPAPGFWLAHSYIQTDLGLTNASRSDIMRVNNGAVDPYPANTDIFSTNQHKQGGMASIIAGLRWKKDQVYLPTYSLGFRYQYFFNQNIGGTITQYSDPDFVNYNYQLKTHSNVFSAISKINLVEYKHFSPYIDAGVGVALNQTGSYQETAIGDVVARIDSPAFSSHRNSQFSYSVGTGIDYQLNPRWLVSVGYEYQDLGAVQSGYGQMPWSAQRLSLGKYTNNTGLISVSYLPGVN